MKRFCLSSLVAVIGVLWAIPVRAANYTWTNRVDGGSGYWTTIANWGTTTAHPVGGDSAFLTNSFIGSYTNILDVSIATLTALSLSNSQGQAWLWVQSPGALTVTTLNLGNGGRLRVDTGGQVTATNLTFSGSSGIIYLNNGGTLQTTGLTMGNNSVTGLVTSTSGSGGTWNLNNSAINLTGGSGKQLVVNGGVTVTNVNGLTIAGDSGDYNSLYITNVAGLFGSGVINVGSRYSGGNTGVLSGTTWDGAGQYMAIGGRGANYGRAPLNNNYLMLASGIWTNFGGVFVGNNDNNNGGNVSGNRLVVTGATTRLQVNGVTVGFGNQTTVAGSYANNNRFEVSGGASVTNQGALTIGSAGPANTTASWNRVELNGGIWTNAGAVTIGSSTGGRSEGNQFIATNSTVYFGGLVTVGGSGGNYNTNALVFRNSTVTFAGGLTLGAGSYNSYSITADQGNTITGMGTLSFATTTQGSTYNTGVISVVSWNGLGYEMKLAAAYENNYSNSLQLVGGVFTNFGALTIGYPNNGTGNDAWNSLVVTGTNTLLQVNGATVGKYRSATNMGNSNAVVVADGAVFRPGTLTVSDNASLFGNYASITGGGVLEANTLTVNGAANGNMITNNGGIYQFTSVTPTLSASGISLVDGTISFRAVTNADVNSSLGSGALKNIKFAGNNTFMLNAASNSLTVGQTYTFQNPASSPSNYVGLALVNGATAYRNGNVTIGSTGTFLAKDTTAVITGLFTNQGAAVVDNATVEFQSAFFNAGQLTLRNGGSLKGAGVVTLGGTLAGNGTVEPTVTATGTVAPGESLGTLNFSANLTLQGSLDVELDPTGAGSADKIVVASQLTLSGATLDVTTLGTLNDTAYIIATYGTLSGTFGTINGVPGSYEVVYDYNGNNIAVIIPEPSALTLVGAGLLLLVATRRRRRD